MEKKKEKLKSQTYRTIVFIICLFAFIGSFVLANTYEKVQIKDYYKEDYENGKLASYLDYDDITEEVFNTDLLYGSLAGTAIFALFGLLFTDMLKTQEEIKEQLIKNNSNNTK